MSTTKIRNGVIDLSLDTGASKLCAGTIAQREAKTGAIRFNTQTQRLEYSLDGTNWISISTVASDAASNYAYGGL
jgi:hypothetical protein